MQLVQTIVILLSIAAHGTLARYIEEVSRVKVEPSKSSDYAYHGDHGVGLTDILAASQPAGKTLLRILEARFRLHTRRMPM
ncbi:hypothetical protein F5Y11DRAFT_345789 [Daldinia sp. FL1419]|nr:hypothetical protein F5Y11DRAFT_345789 [Daldinia sp. FL1419]